MVIETKITKDDRVILKMNGKRTSRDKVEDAVGELAFGETFTIRNQFGKSYEMTRRAGVYYAPYPYCYDHIICLSGGIRTGFVTVEEVATHLAFDNC